MFPTRYFCNTYFGPRYWPKDGVPDIGLGIVEAIQLYAPGAAGAQLFTPGAEAVQGVQ